MLEVMNIFNKLKDTSGRLEKESILHTHKDNTDFTKLLHFLLNPYIVVGVGKKKLNKFKDYSNDNITFVNIFHLIEYLKMNNTGSDEMVKEAANFINHQPIEIQEFYTGIIRKDLKIGLQASTVNKVYGKTFVPKFEVQLAKKFHDEIHKVKGKKFVLTEKLDGVRCILRVVDGKVSAFSRQGQPISQLIDIFEEAVLLSNGIYDGELVIANADDYKDRDVLQQTLKIVRTDGVKQNVILHVFDYLHIDEFENGKSKVRYFDSREFLEQELVNNLEWIKLLPILYTGTNLDAIPELLKGLEEKGKEGLMLNLDVPYVTKRTDGLLKIKTMNTMDVRVIGFEEGEGKYTGTLGKIIVDYKGYELGCGSGFSDSDRFEVWGNKDEFLGKLVEIQYFRESKNADGGLSVSFPIFKQWRFDKDEVSYY